MSLRVVHYVIRESLQQTNLSHEEFGRLLVRMKLKGEEIIIHCRPRSEALPQREVKASCVEPGSTDIVREWCHSRIRQAREITVTEASGGCVMVDEDVKVRIVC